MLWKAEEGDTECALGAHPCTVLIAAVVAGNAVLH